jgi:hypothetical protein
MIIVYENNCQVQSDIFFVREEPKILTNRDGNLILIREHRSLLAAKGGRRKQVQE